MAVVRALGIDVSLWQDNNSTPQMVDFNVARSAGASFAFIKASQAVYLDPDFIMNWQAAAQSGIIRGAYHYLDFKNMPAGKDPIKWAGEQAAFFYGALRNSMGELTPACDFEDAGTLPTATLVAALKQFMEVFFALSNKRCILYTGKNFWAAHGTEDTYWAQYPLWVAQYYYTTVPAAPTLFKPFTNWVFWQYTNKGEGKKYGCESTLVDLNVFNGTVDQFYQYANVPVPTDPGKIARLNELDLLQAYINQRKQQIG